MEVSSQVVPAIVLLIANLMSGHHSKLRWEVVTAIFGWTGLIGLLIFVVVLIVWPDSDALDYLIQIAAFCLITALARDYERILKPLFSWNR